jgi:quinol monooxygenase YgiN
MGLFMHPQRGDLRPYRPGLRGEPTARRGQMKVGLVALHYPRREHRDEMISRVRRAAEVIGATPGCLAVDCWVSDDGQAVVTTGQWESEQALTAGFAAVQAAGVDFDYDERESRPREVFRLISA